MTGRHIVIVSDAWTPQMNGVVRTLCATRAEIERRGHRVTMITPNEFASLPCPTYPDIRLALAWPGAVARRLEAARADAVHIATEGPLGLAARRWCMRRGQPFTTAYHTQFPDYVAARTPIPADMVWRYIRWFHRPAGRILAATPSLRDELTARGLPQVAPWGRGVDLEQFGADGPLHPLLAGLPRPVMLYVGRVAVEKTLEAFLALDRPGSKLVVGHGPALDALKAQFPAAHFPGPMHGAELAAAYRSADVFVFPSRTDTFGLVMIEAMACGTPVAAYPVMGPRDVVPAGAGALDEDLGLAIDRALGCDRAAAAAVGASHSWAAATDQFLAALAFCPRSPPPAGQLAFAD